MAGSVQRRIFFLAVSLALLILTASFFWYVPTLKVSPDSLMSMMDSGETPVIIDVRNRIEYDRGHIPSAINVAMGLLFFQHDEIAVSQKSDIVVYCNSGVRGRIASVFLRGVGFESIYLLDGQLNGWRKKGYPVTQNV